MSLAAVRTVAWRTRRGRERRVRLLLKVRGECRQMEALQSCGNREKWVALRSILKNLLRHWLLRIIRGKKRLEG